MAVAVKAYLQQAFDRIEALELRERILLLTAAIVVLYLAIDSLGLQPTLKAQQVTEQNMTGMEMKLGALREQANLLNYKTSEDSRQSRLESRDRLTGELAALDESILRQLGALVDPTQAAQVLEQVVSKHQGLKINSLQANSAPLDQIDIDQEHTADLNQYQLEIELEGGYINLLRYLQALETLPWKFFWQNVDFQVSEHPRAVTRLQLYTLGAAKNG